MIRLGLTGSLAMGKSTIARLCVERGIALYDCDARVHELYGPDGAATKAIAARFEGVLDADGGIDRDALGRRVWADARARLEIEQIAHPLIAQDRADFLERHEQAGTALVVLDIPLLYEIGVENTLDKILVVTCSAAEQKRRALARSGMTPSRFEAIIAAQTPDAEKRLRADYVIDTESSDADIRQKLDRIIEDLTGLK